MTETTGNADRAENAERAIIPAYLAARLAVCSAKTLANMARRGELTSLRREGYSCRFYYRDEIEALRPREVDE